MENIIGIYRKNMFAPDDQKVDVLAAIKELSDINITNEDGANLYHIAASFFDAETIGYLFEQGLKVRTDKYGNTPLHSITRSPYLNNIQNIEDMADAIYNSVKKLLEIGVNGKKKNQSDEIAYYEAGLKRMHPFIQAMADGSIKMNAVGDEGKNLLHSVICHLAYNKDMERTAKIVKILIDSESVDSEDKDIFGATPLVYAQRNNAKQIAVILTGDESAAKTGGKGFREAILSNDTEAIDGLIENGADVNTEVENGLTPLMLACYYPSSRMVEYLIGKGADVNYKSGEKGYTGLTHLFGYGVKYLQTRMTDPLQESIAIIRLMIDNGLDTNAIIDDKGNTAINTLSNVSYGHEIGKISYSAIEELIDNGADIDMPNLDGLTPLMSFMVAGDENKFSIAELLLDNNAATGHVDKYGNTALIYAAGNTDKLSSKKLVELLLDSGNQDLERTNNLGETALDIAVKNNNDAVVKLLLG